VTNGVFKKETKVIRNFHTNSRDRDQFGGMLKLTQKIVVSSLDR